MGEKTQISWADSSWNPWIGCTKVSPACDHCYAERDWDKRKHRVQWGAGNPRSRTSAANWKLPERWNRERWVQCSCGWRGAGLEGGGGCGACGKHATTAPARRRVFCASLADWLDNEVPIEWLVDLLNTIRQTQNLDWLLLTKRIGNWRTRLEAAALATVGRQMDLNLWLTQWLFARTPPPNVWLGSTVVDRPEMLRDAEKLKRVPVSVRFWSVEPMLGDLGEIPAALMPHWIITGAESGPHARPLQLQWVRSVVQQANAAGVAVHVKQLGRVVYDDGMSGPDEHWPAHIRRSDNGRGYFSVGLSAPKGSIVSEWPPDLRVQEFPRSAA